jgi:hypothetical protein
MWADKKMINQNNFSALANTLPGPLYTDGMNIWLIQAGPKNVGVVQKLGSFYEIILKQYFQEIVSEGMDYANKIHDLRFALCDLVSWLRFLDTGQSEPPSPEIQRAVSDFTNRASTLEQKINMPQCQQTIAPSIIIAGLVIKLMPTSTDNYDITINNINHKFLLNEIRPISEALAQIQSFISLNENLIHEAEAFASSFISDLEKMISYFFPTSINDRPYRVLYQGHHELHYGSSSFVLVRGPLTARIENPKQKGPFYVAIPVTGRTRAERIATVPYRATNPNEFWSANKKFMPRQSVCMGNRLQYTRLSSPLINDADALVQWLDAAVNIATNSSQFHQSWRNQRNTLSQIRNRQIGR